MYTKVIEMNLEKQNKTRIFGLDIIRSVAILMVVFSHLYYLIDSKNALFISISGLLGFFGVELFFVLSGFLIGTILLKQFLDNSFTIKEVIHFLKRRWFRTLPNYYLILFINLFIAFQLGYLTNDAWKYFLFLQNFSQYSITFFTESWSLSIEEWAYILAPIFLLFVWKLHFKNKKVSFIVSVLILILIFHLIRYFNYLELPITDINLWNTNIKSVVWYRIDSILFGFVVAWLVYFFRNKLKKIRIYLLIIAFHLFLFQFVIMNSIGYDIATSPLYYNVYYFSLTSLTIVLAMPFFVFWENSKYFNKPVLFISNTSYGMYLLHYSVISVLFKFAISANNIALHPLLIILFYLLITFFLSYFLYRFYEKPLMNLRDKF